MSAPSNPGPAERRLTLVSHALCPYVQRAAIALAEKGVPHRRRVVDLSDKPDWFRRISPLGKVPLLLFEQEGRQAVLFESAAILEYLEETAPPPLHPRDPVERARHRGWIEYGSTVLNRIASYYSAPDEAALAEAAAALRALFVRLEEALGDGPWFAGADFSLVDAVFGPVFRYFDVFDGIEEHRILDGLPRVAAWRSSLAARPSVAGAVAADYPARLARFVADRRGALAARLAA